MHMRKVIDGKVYDTSTATKVADYSRCSGSGDDVDEALYRTAKGRWFLAGEGGPLSRYGESVPGNRSAYTEGSGLIALSPAEALAWCEDHEVDAETIEEYFKLEEA